MLSCSMRQSSLMPLTLPASWRSRSLDDGWLTEPWKRPPGNDQARDARRRHPRELREDLKRDRRRRRLRRLRVPARRGRAGARRRAPRPRRRGARRRGTTCARILADGRTRGTPCADCDPCLPVEPYERFRAALPEARRAFGGVRRRTPQRLRRAARLRRLRLRRLRTVSAERGRRRAQPAAPGRPRRGAAPSRARRAGGRCCATPDLPRAWRPSACTSSGRASGTSSPPGRELGRIEPAWFVGMAAAIAASADLRLVALPHRAARARLVPHRHLRSSPAAPSARSCPAAPPRGGALQYHDAHPGRRARRPGGQRHHRRQHHQRRDRSWRCRCSPCPPWSASIDIESTLRRVGLFGLGVFAVVARVLGARARHRPPAALDRPRAGLDPRQGAAPPHAAPRHRRQAARRARHRARRARAELARRRSSPRWASAPSTSPRCSWPCTPRAPS